MEPLGAASNPAFFDWLVLVLLGAVTFFLKRFASQQDELENKVADLATKVAVLIDRDRRSRLEDYQEENRKLELARRRSGRSSDGVTEG